MQAASSRHAKSRTVEKAKPHTENVRGLNLAAVRYTTVHVTKLLS